MNANTHIHLPPNFSAFETVEDAVRAAAGEGIRVLGAGNYYDHTVYGDFIRRAVAAGIYPLPGIEIVARDGALAAAGRRANDPGNPGKVYLCGKSLRRYGDAMPASARATWDRIRDGDAARMEQMTERVRAAFAAAGMDTGLAAEDVKQMVRRRHGVPPETVFLQERHVAMAFQRWIWDNVPEPERAERLSRALGAPVKADDPVAVQDAIRSHLMKAGKPAFVEERFVSVEEARRLVLDLGGIPCYPLLGDGAGDLTEFEVDPDAMVEALRAWGIHAAEFISTRNAPEVLERYAVALRDAGFVVTNGTEHNTLERAPITPAAKGGAPIPPCVDEIFEEGACVLVAHRDGGPRGEPGFVDEAGAPGTGFADADARIRAFAERGRRVLSEGHAGGTG